MRIAPAAGLLIGALFLAPSVRAQNTAGRLARAEAAAQQHQWRRAEQLLAGLQADNVSDAAAILHVRGLAEAGLGEPQKAAGDLQRAYQLNPQRRFYAADAGLALLRANAAEAASRALAVATQAAPQDPRLWRALAVADLRMGRNQAAATAARRAIEVGPMADAANLYLLVAQALGNDGQIGAALAGARKAARLSPQSPNAHLALGILLAQQSPPGRTAAEKELRRAEVLAPPFAPAFLQLGKLWLREGRLRQAIAQLKEARRLAPEVGEATYLLAQAYAHAGDRAKAAALMQEYKAARRQRREQLSNQTLPTFIVQ